MQNFLLILFLGCSGLLSAQVIQGNLDVADEQQTHQIITSEGRIFNGRVLGFETNQVLFLMGNDTLQFELKQLETIAVIAGEGAVTEVFRSGKGNAGVPQNTEIVLHGYQNILFSSTGFGLKKGAGEYKNIEIAWNTFEYGISDQISVEAGFIFPIYAVLRGKWVRSYSEKIHYGLGADFFIKTTNNLLESFGYYHGILTVGNSKQFFNLRLGYVQTYELEDTNLFLTTFGTQQPIGKKWLLCADVAYAPFFNANFNSVLPSLMVAWYDSRHRIDFGFMGIPTNFGNLIFLPGIAYRRHFQG